MFIQKSLDFPFQEVPGRKSVPEAQPLLKPEKTKAAQASTPQKDPAFQNRKQDPEEAGS